MSNSTPSKKTTSPASGPAVRISGIVRPFSGEGDIVQWMEKLEIVADLRGVQDVPKLLPLFLEGPAFAVYNEMDSTEKNDLSAIKRTLTDAFSINAFSAYEQLIRRTWKDEPVDVYLSDLRRLAKLAGIESQVLLRRAFIVGLPSVVSRELRALSSVDSTNLSALVDRARVLMAELVTGDLVAISAQPRAARGRSMGQVARKCFQYGGPHFVRNCPSPAAPSEVSCWTCGGEGHVSRCCSQGNGSGRAGAPAAFPDTD